MGKTQESGNAKKVDPDPSQDPGESSGGATSSISEGLSDADFEKVFSDPRFEKQIQKHTAKTMSNLEKKVDAIPPIKRYQELIAEGLDPKAAERQLQHEQDMETVNKLASGAGAAGGGQTSPVSGEPSSLSVMGAAEKIGLDLSGLTSDQTDELFVINDGAKDQDDLNNKVLKFKANLSKQAKAVKPEPPPGPGEIVPPKGSSASSTTPSSLDGITDSGTLWKKGMEELNKK